MALWQKVENGKVVDTSASATSSSKEKKTNNLDKDYLEKRKIAWRNVAGYSTETVAQHTFALLFYLYENC